MSRKLYKDWKSSEHQLVPSGKVEEVSLTDGAFDEVLNNSGGSVDDTPLTYEDLIVDPRPNPEEQMILNEEGEEDCYPLDLYPGYCAQCRAKEIEVYGRVLQCKTYEELEQHDFISCSIPCNHPSVYKT